MSVAGVTRLTQLSFLIVAFLGFSTNMSRGQTVDNSVNVGFPVNGVFVGSSIDSVQMNNGNLHIEIPLFSLPGRGKLPASYKLVYDNKSWTYNHFCPPLGGQCHSNVMPETGGNYRIRLADPFEYGVTYQVVTTLTCGTQHF